MSSITNDYSYDLDDRYSTDISEDSHFYRGLCMIPLVGIFVEMVQLNSLAMHIDRVDKQDAKQTPRLIKLLEVTNSYKKVAFVRYTVTTIVALALSIISIFGFIAAMMQIYLICTAINDITVNHRRIFDLQHGLQPSFRS